MKLFLPIPLILFVLSCNKSSNNPIPDQPLPSVDSTQAASHINLGKLVFLTDTFRIYDANTGKLLIYSGPYGTLFGSAINNTTIDNNLIYQSTWDGLVALNATTGNVEYWKYFNLGHFGVSSCFPIIEGQYMYQCFYSVYGSSLFCLNKLTGGVVWQTNEPLGGDTNEFFPTTDGTSQNIIVAGLYGPVCFSKTTGQLIWKNYSSYEYGKLTHPKVCSEDKVMFYSQNYQTLYTFNAGNGDFLWKINLSSFGYVRSPRPYIYGNKAYISFQQEEGNPFHGRTVVSIDPNTGQTIDKWSYSTGYDVYYYDKYFYLFDDAGLSSSPMHLSKHLLSDGATVWSKALSGYFGYGMVPTPGFIYYTEASTLFDEGSRKMTILDQATGNLLKQYPVYTDISFTPAILDSLNNAYYQSR
jgi:hypothetical protein